MQKRPKISKISLIGLLEYFPQAKSCVLAFGILSIPQRMKMILLILVSILINFLDLVGVAVVGIISSVAINGITARAQNQTVMRILEKLSIDDKVFDAQIVFLISLAVFVFIFKTLTSLYLNRRILFFLSFHSAQMSSDLVFRLFQQRILFVRKRGIQESIYALTTGISQIALGVIGGISKLISDSTLLIILLAGLIFVDPISAFAVSLLYLAVAFVLHKVSHKTVSEKSGQIMREVILINRKVAEFIQAYREIFVKGKRDDYAKEISNLRFSVSAKEAEVSFLSTLSKYIMEIVMIISICLLISIQLNGESATRTLAVSAVFIAASARIMPAIVRLQQTLVTVNRSIAASAISFDLLEELRLSDKGTLAHRSYQSVSPQKELIEDFEPSVLVRDLTFTYPGNSAATLRKVNLEIAPGDFVGIVGASGSGKTTLIDVLLGVHDDHFGEVKVSKLSPKEVIKKWPGQIGYVPQDSYLIEGSVLENILLGADKSKVTQQDIEFAFKNAELGEVWGKESHGLAEVKVLEGGSNISGGQKQRIGLARALVSRPKLLILDEATSALDGLTEEKIVKNLLKMNPPITIIAIAHRLSSIVTASKVVLLEANTIEAIGTFEELRKLSRVFDSQAKAMGL